jgi:hypothetical protein
MLGKRSLRASFNRSCTLMSRSRPICFNCRDTGSAGNQRAETGLLQRPSSGVRRNSSIESGHSGIVS